MPTIGQGAGRVGRFDASVLADTVRTDRRRLIPPQPATQATVMLRTLVRARADLVVHPVAVANQLRAHLQTVLPGAVGLFTKPHSPISLALMFGPVPFGQPGAPWPAGR